MKTKDIVCVHAHINGSFVPAGVLEYYSAENESMCKFKYFSSYLNNTSSIAIDLVQLPLNDSVYSTPRDSEYFNGIRDSCPDSWGDHLLEIATAKAGISMKEVDYILYAGPDRTGALGFSSAPSTPPFSETPPWNKGKEACGEELLLEDLAVAADRIASDEDLPEAWRQFFVSGSSLGGARPKASCRAHLAKFQHPRDPWHACRAEAACMALAPTAALPQRELSAYPC